MKNYQVIYADPPWKVIKFQRRKARPNQGKSLDYPVMSLEDIKKLNINQICSENSVLFLWATHAYLPKAFEVMKEWGFKYQRTITWDKKGGMCLFGFHHRTEFLLFGYKGALDKFPKRKAFPTLITEKSTKHSRKPDVAKKFIEPFGDTRIELFAREKTEGWDVWGNEVENSIELKELSHV